MLNLLIRIIHPSEGAHPDQDGPRFTSGRKASGSVLGLLLVGLLALAGCQGKQADTGPDTTAEPQTTMTTAPKATPSPEATAPPTSEKADTPAEASPKAAANSVEASGSQLPETLVKSWEPESNVLFEFGPMTVSGNQITWSSGQSSSYAVVSTEGGYLLKLDPVPSFFDTPNPYIKLIPKPSNEGTVSEVEVAFYESEQKAQSDEYIMFGTYAVK